MTDCDTRLARYRAALEAGTDPVVVSAWIAEVQTERLAAEVELERATGQQNRRMSRDQLAALVNGLGHLLGVLATAAPEDKAEVYRRLGLQLTYDPARRVVTVESHLGPDGSGALPRGARPSSGPTSGAPAAEPVGESQCRRGDLNPHDLAVTSPSSWRVCLFRHSDVGGDPIAGSCTRRQRGTGQDRSHDRTFGLVGGTRMAQFCTAQSNDGPLGFKETPAVRPDHAKTTGWVNSGRATICCQSAASTCV